MTLPNCSSAYPMPDGNGFWCQRAGTAIAACAPECVHRTGRPVRNVPTIENGRVVS
jgi:hypothetical protein